MKRFRDKICVLLGYYAASFGDCLPTFRDKVSVPRSALFWDITQRRVVIGYRRFGTKYRSQDLRSSGILRSVVWWLLTDVSGQNIGPKICALLGYYAASWGDCLPTFRDKLSVPRSALFWDITQRRVVIAYRRFGTVPFPCSRVKTDTLSRNVGKPLPPRCVISQKSAHLSAVTNLGLFQYLR
jgi:hypothetical protein